MYPAVFSVGLFTLLGCVTAVTVQHYPTIQHDVVLHKKPPIPILKQSYEQSKDGYQFSYETGNGIHAQESGYIKNKGDDKHETLVQQGTVTYHDEHGHPITLTYVADEHGFQAQGAHLPTPPPIPHAIQKALEQQAALSHHNVINHHADEQQQQAEEEAYDAQQYGHY